MLQIILAALPDPHDDDADPTADPLPARPIEDDGMATRRIRTPPPGQVLVQSAAPDAESASAFHAAALAHAWTHIPSEQPQRPGQREVLLRFLLDRRRPCAPSFARPHGAAEQNLLRSAP